MPVDSPFQYNPDKLPDCRFEPGCLAHVVVGNEDRALDYRRTPVRIREVRYSSGLMVLEILDFEDRGNTWEIPFEDVRRFQFASGATRAGLRERSRLETVVHTLNRPLEIACDRDVRSATLSAVEDAEREAAQWVKRRSVARRSGRIDFSTNAGEHIVRRIAWVRALYRELGVDSVLVYRGIHCAGVPTRPINRTFVSTTTAVTVAESLACFREPTNVNKPGLRIGVLMSQAAALERLFMTYMETAQMNSPYRESEVVLLYSSEDVF